MSHTMNANQIKALRKKLGLTAKQLGDMLGVTENTVNRWETGWRTAKGPAATLLRRMAKDAAVPA